MASHEHAALRGALRTPNSYEACRGPAFRGIAPAARSGARRTGRPTQPSPRPGAELGPETARTGFPAERRPAAGYRAHLPPGAGRPGQPGLLPPTGKRRGPGAEPRGGWKEVPRGVSLGPQLGAGPRERGPVPPGPVPVPRRPRPGRVAMETRRAHSPSDTTTAAARPVPRGARQKARPGRTAFIDEVLTARPIRSHRRHAAAPTIGGGGSDVTRTLLGPSPLSPASRQAPPPEDGRRVRPRRRRPAPARGLGGGKVV